jgi:hypothetical protein
LHLPIVVELLSERIHGTISSHFADS